MERTEDDWQAAMDEAPADSCLRMVFADWLDERGDRRGPGYRALGRAGRRPLRYGSPSGTVRWQYECAYHLVLPRAGPWYLPEVWFDEGAWGLYPTRRAAEDAAALAFAAISL